MKRSLLDNVANDPAAGDRIKHVATYADLRGPEFKGDPSFGEVHRDGPQWRSDGPACRTLDDMTPDEIAAIERQYGCPVRPRPKEAAHAAPPFDSTRPVIHPDGMPAAAAGRVRGHAKQPPGCEPGKSRTGKRQR